MCNQCRTLDQYGAALSALHTQLARLLTDRPEVLTPPTDAPALAGLFRLAAEGMTPDRDPRKIAEATMTLTPEQRSAVQETALAMTMIYAGVADLMTTARREQGEEADDSPTPDYLAALREADGMADDDGDDDAPEYEKVTREVAIFGDGKRPSLDQQRQIQALLTELAQKIAVITGHEVKVQSVQTDPRTGRMRPGPALTTVPGQLPTFGGDGDTIIH